MPKVSIIIPVYNVEKYIKEALDSVVNQALKDIEIICINDCSPDNSFDIVKEYAAKDNRFELIEHEKNQGSGVARNNGINIASGRYIMFLDPDDWFELDACEKAYNQISKNNDDVVFFNSQTFDENGNFISQDAKLKPYKEFLDGKSFNLKDVKKNFISRKIACWSRIYNSEFLRKNKIYFSETWRGEDIPFSIKLYLEAENVSVLNECLYKYRKQAEQFHYKERGNSNEFYYNLKQGYNLIPKRKDKDYFLKYFCVYFINLCIQRYFELRTDNIYYNFLFYHKSRKMLKFIDKRQNVGKYYKKINILQYKLFLFCPNYLMFDFLNSYLADKATVEENHLVITFKLFKIKLRIGKREKKTK